MLVKKEQQRWSKTYFESTLKYYNYLFKRPRSEYKKPSLIERLKLVKKIRPNIDILRKRMVDEITKEINRKILKSLQKYYVN